MTFTRGDRVKYIGPGRKMTTGTVLDVNYREFEAEIQWATTPGGRVSIPHWYSFAVLTKVT